MNSMSMTIRSSFCQIESTVFRKIISLFAILLLGLSLSPSPIRADTGTDVPKEDIETLKTKADQGEAEAQYDLGGCYFYGEGVPEDKAEAVNWYRKAAEQGHAPAQFYLAFCYEYGEGVPEDRAEAVNWFRKAAEQGLAPAQSFLEIFYSEDEGVEKDNEEANNWRQKAADQIPFEYHHPWLFRVITIIVVVAILTVFLDRKHGLAGMLTCALFSITVCIIGGIVGRVIGNNDASADYGIFFGVLISRFIKGFGILPFIRKSKLRKVADLGETDTHTHTI